MTVLVTGVTGFVGSHMAEYALARGARVVGACRGRIGMANIEHLRDRITVVKCDLTDPDAVRDLLRETNPKFVVHLAGQSHVRASWEAPGETIIANAIGQVNLLEAIRSRGTRAPRFLVIGSSEEYGLVGESELPIKEGNPLRPMSPYAVSKVAQDLMGFQYFKSYGLPIVRARAFNHEGPRRSDAFLTSSVARQIAEIEAGLRPPEVVVGNLRAVRDYTDVRDIVRGYWLLLERGDPGEVYNLCSGRGWAVHEILEFLIGKSRVQPITVRQDPTRLRPSDVPVLVGDYGKISRSLGWKPEIPFEQTLRDLLAFWRQKISRGAIL